MEKIIFTCKIVTPLVMNGAYADFPELRPPGIKSSLRFWWRALNGHLPIEDEKNHDGSTKKKGIRTLEGEIFGSTTGRSKVLIRIKQNVQANSIRTSLLPHKGGSEVLAFEPNAGFKIQLDCELDQKEMLKNLFIIACTLGGWGKRSRRGFGSTIVTEIDGEPFLPLLDLNGIKACLDKIISNKHRLSSTGTFIESIHTDQSSRDEYPKLWKIQIGQNTKTLQDIGKATHDTKFTDDLTPNKSDYSKSLGDGRPRLASPVIISLLANGKPVICTLKKQSWVDFNLQDKLKNRLL